jgi:hypothetical protein
MASISARLSMDISQLHEKNIFEGKLIFINPHPKQTV